MTRFAALLSDTNATNPGEQQKHLSGRLVDALSDSRLNLWQIGDDIAQANRRVLIGVAPYSMYDLKLLDALNELPLDPNSERVDVFDVLNNKTGQDFERYVPSIGKVYQTPVVGIWKNGHLEDKGSGYTGRELLIKLYGLDRNKIL
jgi:hypothetical protein